MEDTNAQMEELKTRYNQLLNFRDNIDTLNTFEDDGAKVDIKEYEKLQLMLNNKIEENKSLQDVISKHTKEISDYRHKLIEESEKNNEHLKELTTQIKDLRQKNFELENKSIHSNKEMIMKATNEKNKKIFMLEERLKESKSVMSKLKKQMFQKDIQIRQDMDKEYISKNKDLAFRIEELQNENETLLKEIGRRDNALKEKQKEIDLVYQNMAHISTKIETKKLDNSVKKLEKQNTDLLELASSERLQFQDKVKKRDEIIIELEKERDNLISAISQLQRELSNANLSSPKERKSNGKENVAQIQEFLKEITILEKKLDKGRKELEKYAVRLHLMESKYLLTKISFLYFCLYDDSSSYL